MGREPTNQIIDVLSTKVEQARSGDYVALLDLSDDPTEQEIKESYFRLARMVHPDTVQRQSLQDRKEDAAFIFEKVTEAYHFMLDPNKRANYLKQREGSGGNQPSAQQQSRLADEAAKIALHQGRMLLNRRAYAQAEEYFKEYCELKPDDARGFMFLGWSLFQNRERALENRLQEAKAAFSRALKLDAENPDAQYYMALYFKEVGDLPMVQKHIKKALSIKANHVPSLREQRLLEMRMKQEPGQESIGDWFKGLWGKITQKKSPDQPEEPADDRKKRRR